MVPARSVVCHLLGGSGRCHGGVPVLRRPLAALLRAAPGPEARQCATRPSALL
jgi:hypothetical protein